MLSPLAVAPLQLAAAGLHTLQSPPRLRIALNIQEDESQQEIHGQQGEDQYVHDKTTRSSVEGSEEE